VSPADLTKWLPALAELVERMIGAGCNPADEIARIADGYKPRARVEFEVQEAIKKRFGGP
jgi:hypothetical protein